MSPMIMENVSLTPTLLSLLLILCVKLGMGTDAWNALTEPTSTVKMSVLLSVIIVILGILLLETALLATMDLFLLTEDAKLLLEFPLQISVARFGIGRAKSVLLALKTGFSTQTMFVPLSVIDVENMMKMDFALLAMLDMASKLVHASFHLKIIDNLLT